MFISVAAILADSAARRPDHPAVIFEGARVTYGELWDQARRYAAALRDRGIQPGDRVALLLPNSPRFPMIYFGALAAGAVLVPVHGLSSGDDIEYVLRDAAVRLLICDAAMLDAGSTGARLAGVELLTTGESADTGHPRLDVLARDARPIPDYLPRRPDDLALVLYTSGTTGRPKGAMITQLNVVMNVSTTMLAPFDFDEDDVLLGCLPLFHTFGQICGMNTCFRAGATMVLMPKFEAGPALELMVTERCTVFMGVPTMYYTLLEAVTTGVPVPRLDRAFSGGAALPVAVLDAFQQTFGCPVYEGYGLTEASPVVAYNQRSWPVKPGTVGRPIWGVQVEIAEAEVADRIELVPAGVVGEIVIRGHNIMAGYLNRPSATAEVLVDGWFRSGDLGVKDADGYLSIVDRKKDMLVRGGYNVYPREVEEVLVRHPAVGQVAVIGVPDDRLGEEVCAVVCCARGRLPDEELAEQIVSWSRARLAGHKYPRLVKFVDAFPMGPSGKVLKRELVNLFARPVHSR
ncbi:long-chain-fatty-acid--CoA ligase [Nocardia arthritidis]|uniref:AMP-binding protein n=1 Tax=Nocardia arthritidis TaxID=228602 RepID=A0A6G9YM10_9NOCA|nr:long-chain fatty acid--CoA ligase [Nocardia arthritidis]QIS14232.1 AMP-binding protein [Nocardia arthritidis]